VLIHEILNNINVNISLIMKTKLFAFVLAIMASGVLMAQTAPEPADKILAAAIKQAAAGNKNVMIVFHASWCGWCKKFDASVNDPSCKEFFEKSFVINHLTIMENGDMKKLENPGAKELYDSNGGKNGIPFFLIFDKTGKLLANSNMKNEVPGAEAKESNIGCPASKEEVAFFIEILKKTSKISEKEAEKISVRFRQNEPVAQVK
jgi:thioredoxin-related protein